MYGYKILKRLGDFMGTITLVVLAVTVLGLGFGALFGFMRGRDRALLRLGLIILCAILAIALRGVVVDVVMGLEFDGSTLKESLLDSFGSDAEIPERIQSLVVSLVEILIGFVAYFILLYVLRFLTWILVFPFLKLIIRKLEKKRLIKIVTQNANNAAPAEAIAPDANAAPIMENAEYVAVPAPDAAPAPIVLPKGKARKKLLKKHRGYGALVGLGQGILLAFFLFAPLTCLTTQIDQIASAKIGGETLLEIPEEIGISEYSESFIGKFYSTTGRWYYDILTSTTDEDGNDISLSDTLDSAVVILDIADTALTLEDDIKILQKDNVQPQEMITALDNISEKLITIGTSMEEIDEGTMDIIKDLVTSVAGEELSEEEVGKLTEKLTPELFVEAGNGISAFAEYEQIKLDEAEMTPEKASEIINKTYQCMTIVEILEDEEVELEVDDTDKAQFKNAIDNIPNISSENKTSLYSIFGINK